MTSKFKANHYNRILQVRTRNKHSWRSQYDSFNIIC